jgi:hypothetical protein
VIDTYSHGVLRSTFAVVELLEDWIVKLKAMQHGW